MGIFVLFIGFLSSVELVSGECLSPNVRTSLWRSSDLHRRCWSDRDIAVLYARRLFQLVLPTRVVSNVNQLLRHFKMCLKAVRDVATTKETYAMLMRPMVDAIGGYLQAFGLPVAIEEYYEGDLTFATVKRADDMLKSIKSALSTDGGRWTRPINVETSEQIIPYEVVPPSVFDNRCNDLISSADLRHLCKNNKELGWLKAKIPLPFFDDSQSPKAIAVPFRTKTLHSLFDKNSRKVLLRYYTAASHCYATQDAEYDAISPEQRDFDKTFHKWLVREVVPLLHDGVWYPAFGGVYRLLALLSTRGLEFPKNQDQGVSGVRGRCLAKTPETRTPWFFLGSILGFLVMFWFVVYVLLRLRRRRSLLRKSRGGTDDLVAQDTGLSHPEPEEWDVQEDWDHPEPGEWDYPPENWDNQAGNWRNQGAEAQNQIENWPDVSSWDSQDAVVSYSSGCKTPHSDEMLEALIGSLLGGSSAASIPHEQHRNRSPHSKPSTPANSLLSTTVLSHEQPPNPPSRRDYSISGASIVTRNPCRTPFHKSPESV